MENVFTFWEGARKREPKQPSHSESFSISHAGSFSSSSPTKAKQSSPSPPCQPFAVMVATIFSFYCCWCWLPQERGGKSSKKNNIISHFLCNAGSLCVVCVFGVCFGFLVLSFTCLLSLLRGKGRGTGVLEHKVKILFSTQVAPAEAMQSANREDHNQHKAISRKELHWRKMGIKQNHSQHVSPSNQTVRAVCVVGKFKALFQMWWKLENTHSHSPLLLLCFPFSFPARLWRSMPIPTEKTSFIGLVGMGGVALYLSLAPFDRVPFCALFSEIVFRVHTNDGMEREANRVWWFETTIIIRSNHSHWGTLGTTLGGENMKRVGLLFYNNKRFFLGVSFFCCTLMFF